MKFDRMKHVVRAHKGMLQSSTRMSAQIVFKWFNKTKYKTQLIYVLELAHVSVMERFMFSKQFRFLLRSFVLGGATSKTSEIDFKSESIEATNMSKSKVTVRE